MNIKETISQILSPTNATYINGVSVRRDFSKAVLEAMFQGLVEKEGRGVNGKFVTEQEANDAGQIFVNRVKAHYDEGREHGSSKNGGAFNNKGYMSATETVGIEVLQYFDEVILIPRATQDRISVDLAATEISNYVKSINLALNGSSFAAKWLATYKATEDERNVVKIGANDKALDKFIEASSLLDAGDMAHDIDAFDLETRIATFRVNYRPTLLAGGVLTLGGANYGYDIARQGTLDAQSTKRNLEDGYWGTIDGTPVHGISNLSLKYAAWFCGMPDEEFYNGKFLAGWVSSSYANARGVSVLEQIKTIDAHGGQGIEIQPMTKMGAITWYPKGNVAVTTDDYDPIAGLKTIFSGVAADLTFKLKSKGSRFYPEMSAASLTIAADGVTVAATVTALDDHNVDHLKKVAYVVADKAIKTVAEFIKEYGTATYKGVITTLGTKESTTVGNGKVVTCLAIADDGSITLAAKAK